MAIKSFRLLLLAAAVVLCGCSSDGNRQATHGNGNEVPAPGDKFIYGLACDGCSDTAVVFLPADCSDPVTYNIIEATRNHKVFGTPAIGDWIAVLVNPKNPHEALEVIDLDMLKGTWTYQVIPTLKENALKSKGEITAELTDSMKALLFVPREYGFTLKRQYQASSVGSVYRGNSLDHESLVEYPPVVRYTGWTIFNGKLILRGDTLDKTRHRLPERSVRRDTMELVFLSADSLALKHKGVVTGYHRQINAVEANRKASEAAKKQAENDTIRK